MTVSEAAFKTTVYPVLVENCNVCHSESGRGQKPLHSDDDVSVAHVNALAKVNLRQPKDSKLVRRLSLEAHNCWGECQQNADEMLLQVEAWASAVNASVVSAPESSAEIALNDVEQWIANDRAGLAVDDQDYIKYVSLHELHNDNTMSVDDMNTARAGISKILNSTARWAPTVVNPISVNDQNIVYRFDIRDYWGYSRGETELASGASGEENQGGFSFNRRTGPGTADPEFSLLVWDRISKGNFEALGSAKETPNIDGFTSSYVEATQLAYTLSRPDVYNTIMHIPAFGADLMRDISVDVDQGMDSFKFNIVDEAITIRPRLMSRADTADGYYYKTTEIFAFPRENKFPFYDHPIPKFISAFNFGGGESYSFIASLANRIDEDGNLDPSTEYTGEDGLQQAAQEVIWSLPNGLQGYAIFGGVDQRRTDAFTFIVLDPRRGHTNKSSSNSGFGGFSFSNLRLLNGASCMSCHENGLNGAPNNLRDKLDNGELEQEWVNDSDTLARVKELYPTTSELANTIDNDNLIFSASMKKIREGMIVGNDKNIYQESIGYLFEKAQLKYDYKEEEGN